MTGGHVELRILGPLAVSGPRGKAALGGSRERALLARLLLSTNRVVSAERLIDDLWGSDPPAGALGALQACVSRLRKALRGCGLDGVLLTRPPGYVLQVEPGAVDVTRFEALTAQGRELSRAGDYRAAAETLREALALWRGPALADVADAPFARPEASRLEEERIAALEERIEADLACGHHGQVIGELATLVAEHPLRERLWSQRMLALYRAGRQAEALRSYQDLRRTLGEELGIEPSVALVRLEAAMLRHDPELDCPAPAPPAPPSATSILDADKPSIQPAAAEGVVTFLFTDVVGSTQLLDELGDDDAEELRRHHFALLRKAVAEHGGTEVKNLGDGLMVAFSSTLAALGCAMEMQRALDAHLAGQARAMSVRIGLHAGEPVRKDEDFFGTPVVVAKRLCDRAEGGQILVSALVRDLVGRRGGLTFRDLGGLSLKGLADPVATYEVVWSTAAEAGSSPPAASQWVVPLPLPLRRDGPVPVVGRDEELGRLKAAWSAASSGERRVLLVGGEPGIGKSRLASEAARWAHAAGGVVCFGRCDEGMGVPYQPFVEALGRYVQEAPAPALGRLAGELVRLVPEVAGRVRGLPPPMRSDPETERYRLFDAVAAWLAAASQSAPVLLVLDDLHWATKPTLHLLRHLVRSGEQLALLVVATYRDTALDLTADLADAVAELLREPGVEPLPLSGLDQTAVTALMEARAGHELDDEGRALAAVLHAETAGNPFFVGEVLTHLTEHGMIVRREGRWGAGQPVAELVVPKRVADVVRRRLARLPEATNEVLTLAAVLGEHFRLPVLAEASGAPEQTTLDALDPALAARLVREIGVGNYQFAHALVRSTLEEGLGPTRRAALHGAAGRAVEIVHAGELDAHATELAHHFARAGDQAKGVEYSTRAGDRALALFAHQEAASYYRRALELLDVGDGPDDGPLRCDLLISLGEAQRRAGDPGHRETFLDAVGRARRRGDTDRLVRAALANSRGTLPSTTAVIDTERIEALTAAIEAVGEAETPERARLLATLGLEVLLARDTPQCIALSDEALGIARRLGDPATLAHVLGARFYAVGSPDTWSERLATSAELFAVAEQLGDPVVTCRAAMGRLRAALEGGDIEETDRCIRVVEGIAAELGQPGLAWLAAWYQVGQSLLKGRLNEAEMLALDCLELGRAAGQQDAAVWFTLQQFRLRYDQGRLEEVEGLLTDAVEQFPLLRFFQAMLALLHCEIGRHDQARAAFVNAAAEFDRLPLDVQWMQTVTSWAAVCARLDDANGAETLYRLLEPYPNQVPIQGGVSGGSVAHYLGMLAGTRGLINTADEAFAVAESVHARMQAPTWLAWTRLEWAEILIRRGGSGGDDRARDLLDQAMATARDLGLGIVKRRAAALLATMS